MMIAAIVFAGLLAVAGGLLILIGAPGLRDNSDGAVGLKASFFLGLALVVIAGAIAFTLSIRPAHGHQAPMGWQYDIACCSDRDCRPLSRSEVNTIRRAADQSGYLADIEGFSEPVLFAADKIKPSKDEYFHGCVGASGIGYCLYIPMGV